MSYGIGVSEDKGQRRTMEDAYAFVADFASVRGQGYFAIFDGHAGKHAAEWCGQHFHEVGGTDFCIARRTLTFPDYSICSIPYATPRPLQFPTS
jgi:protein phosphatase PTC1